jgi:hypothetical protein
LRLRLRKDVGERGGLNLVTVRHIGDERGNFRARRIERLRVQGRDGRDREQRECRTHGRAARETIPCHVATSLRRECTDMRIPKPAMRVTSDVPP